MGRESKYTVFLGRHKSGPKTHEKVFNITTYQGNAIKPTMRYHLSPDIRLLRNTQSITNIGMDVDKQETLYTDGRVISYIVTIEDSMEFPQKTKNRTTV